MSCASLLFETRRRLRHGINYKKLRTGLVRITVPPGKIRDQSIARKRADINGSTFPIIINKYAEMRSTAVAQFLGIKKKIRF